MVVGSKSPLQDAAAAHSMVKLLCDKSSLRCTTVTWEIHVRGCVRHGPTSCCLKVGGARMVILECSSPWVGFIAYSLVVGDHHWKHVAKQVYTFFMRAVEWEFRRILVLWKWGKRQNKALESQHLQHSRSWELSFAPSMGQVDCCKLYVTLCLQSQPLHFFAFLIFLEVEGTWTILGTWN